MNKKGVSMISLVIIIIVIIILVAITATIGFNYITKVNNVRADALGSAIGEAARNRQNDVSVGVSTRYYEGYLFNVSAITADRFKNIEYLPQEDENADGIPDCLQEDGAIWYIVDAEAASNLGVDQTEEFLTRNISSYLRSSVTEDEKDELIRVVLTNYTSSSGKGYYVRMPAFYAIDAISSGGMGACPNSPTGTHKFTVPTCTEDSVCIYNCGTTEGPKALGHDFIESSCTEDGRCSRCGMVNSNDLKKGHLFISNADVTDQDTIDVLAKNNCIAIENSNDPSKAWVADASKHWHQCIRCGIKEDINDHTKAFEALSDGLNHQEVCSICLWRSIVSPHKLEHESIEPNKHRVWCTACMFETEHTDSGWQNDHDIFHYRVCPVNDACNDLTLEVNGVEKKIIFKEAHYDDNNDWVCDACARNLDIYPPVNFAFEDYGTYVRVAGTTTSKVTLEAYTVDKETHVAYYEFGQLINGTIEWKSDGKVNVTDDTRPYSYTFTNLNPTETYTFYVRAADAWGNLNTPYRIDAKTFGFPEFLGITNIPTKRWVKGPHSIGVEQVKILPEYDNIYVQYKHKTGAWSAKTPIASMSTLNIPVEVENDELYFKFVNNETNQESIVFGPYDVNFIDNTPPKTEITARTGDTSNTSALYHQATVKITDERSGIDTNTRIRYAWSTSNTVAPTTNIQTVNTPNLDVASSVSFNVTTPEGVNGTYYLWVLPGTKDEAGNEVTNSYNEQGYSNGTVHSVGFIVDDEKPQVKNIKMLDLTPAVAGEDPGDRLFIKTGETLTVTFTTTKILKANPIVRINGIDMTKITKTDRVSANESDYTCTLVIDDTFTEGTLQLLITDVISANGRVGEEVYRNADLVEGPVYYDKTLPKLEYIKKK